MELMMYMCVWECVSVCGRGTWRRESSEWRLPCLAVRDHVGVTREPRVRGCPLLGSRRDKHGGPAIMDEPQQPEPAWCIGRSRRWGHAGTPHSKPLRANLLCARANLLSA